jgi:glycosyltransferase involved in cell wall biosynthesis
VSAGESPRALLDEACFGATLSPKARVSTRMRIVIDGFPLRVGSAGIGMYTQELLGALTRVAPEHECYLADFGPRLSTTKLCPGLPEGDYKAEIGRLVARVTPAWKALPLALRESLTRLQAARLGADLYFGTNFFGVFHPSFKTIITVHDMSHVHYPRETYPPMYRKLTKNLPQDASRAHAILADSESTKHDTMTYLGVPPAKVHVIYSGVSRLFRPIASEAERAVCRRRYALPTRFLLYLGTVEPRKNVLRLLEAFRLLSADPRFQHHLVMAGGRGWRDTSIQRTLASFPQRTRIVLTGWVEQADLPALYSMADVFVYPSLYEGFGLPVVEAMACGTPVITSNVSSLPEVAGDAALLVDPRSTDSIALAVRRLIEDPGLTESLRKKGLNRARLFSWESSARRALEIFTRVVRG